jgi:ABC-type uncharacterized transport system involved in gliding motility auxiliary subunit
MKDSRRFAPFGLVFSGLAILSLIGFALVKGLSQAGLYTPADPTLLDKGLWFSLAGIIFGVALAAMLDPDRARQFLTGRQAQYGSNAIIMLVAFSGVLFFANMLAYQNPKTWDLTENRQNTLAQETLDLLKKLPEPITAKAYYTVSAPNDEAKKLLDNFKQNSDGKFDYVFIDPNLDPVTAQADNITRDGTIVLHMGERSAPVTFADEQQIGIAIIKLINPQSQVIYFLVGHGEKDTETQGEESYTYLKTNLVNKNYTVKTLTLASAGSVPADAAAVVVAGPIVPLSESEVSALSAYLDAGGGLVVLQDPPALTQYGDKPNPLDGLLEKWGIKMHNDIVIDPNANPALYAIADSTSYPLHPITANLQRVTTAFPTARSLEVIPGTPYTVIPLAATGQAAWGETNVDSITGQLAYDEGVDIPGPITLAIASQDYNGGGRLAAFGDSEFPVDSLYQRGSYGDILVNAIDWAAEQENLINLNSRTNIDRTYNPPSAGGLIGIFLLSVCIIPLTVIGFGVWAWASRRRRG